MVSRHCGDKQAGGTLVSRGEAGGNRALGWAGGPHRKHPGSPCPTRRVPEAEEALRPELGFRTGGRWPCSIILDSVSMFQCELTCSHLIFNLNLYNAFEKQTDVIFFSNKKSSQYPTQSISYANQNYNETPPHTCRMATINKTGSNKSWRGCGQGTLVPCWWEYKPVQPL